MKTITVRFFCSVLICIFLLTSCGPLPPPGTALTPQEREEAQKACIAKYTTLGAIGGAAVGLLLGGKKTKLEGALIGAAAGGALAFAIAYGKCLATFSDLNSYPVAGYQETVQRIGYTSAQGYVTKIEDFYIDPTGVAPGGKVKLNAVYYVMAPEGNMEAKVTEIRTVSFYDASERQWKELGSVPQEITSALGSRRAEGSFDMPKDVPEGLYRITLTIEANGKKDSVTKELTVKRGLAMGPTNIGNITENTHAFHQQGGKAIINAKVSKKPSTITIVSKTLSLRAEPTTKSQIIATLNQGEIYEVLNRTAISGDIWFRIRLDNGVEGWVSGNNVKLVE
ncbi:MAG: SH3 domain-containing protein [Thermodesulfovibrionales bacterium]|nr:SH3 domain-containing protein [Thermodesulfovibrionales bacterium]